MVGTWKRKREQDTRDIRHVRQQKVTVRCDAGGDFFRPQHGPALFKRRSAMHRSKLDIGGADARAGGMSINSGSGGAGASGMGASSSSYNVSAMAHSLGSSGAGSSSVRFEKSSSWAQSAAASSLQWAYPCGHTVGANRCATPGFSRKGVMAARAAPVHHDVVE